MKHETSDEAWQAYRQKLWQTLCKTVTETNQKIEQNSTGFSGAGYSLYMEIASAVDRYCETRRAVEPQVPELDPKSWGIWGANLLDDPSSDTEDRIVEYDLVSKTIDIVDHARLHYTRADPYYIKFDSIDTVEDFIDWIRHLAQKSWCTPEHLSMLANRYEFLVRNGYLSNRWTTKGGATTDKSES